MIKAYFDGSCIPINPGGNVRYGAIAYRDKEVIWKCSESWEPEVKGETSNNIAEYLGFIAVLKFLKDLKTEERVQIYGDSNLVVQQMNGNWRIKRGLYCDFAVEAMRILNKLRPRPLINWISREKNTIADGLSRGIFL